MFQPYMDDIRQMMTSQNAELVNTFTDRIDAAFGRVSESRNQKRTNEEMGRREGFVEQETIATE